MPYSNPKQAMAIFLDIKRRQGAGAAKKFADKHHTEMSASAKATARDRSGRAYKSRKRRSS